MSKIQSMSEHARTESGCDQQRHTIFRLCLFFAVSAQIVSPHLYRWRYSPFSVLQAWPSKLIVVFAAAACLAEADHCTLKTTLFWLRAAAPKTRDWRGRGGRALGILPIAARS